MPRKLRHTLRAFAIAVSLFTVGLIVSAPPPAPGTTGLTVATDPAAAPAASAAMRSCIASARSRTGPAPITPSPTASTATPRSLRNPSPCHPPRGLFHPGAPGSSAFPSHQA